MLYNFERTQVGLGACPLRKILKLEDFHRLSVAIADWQLDKCGASQANGSWGKFLSLHSG